MVARSPIERLVAFKAERGWRNLRLYSDMSGDYTRDYVSPEDKDVPGLNVFTRRDGTIRNFWGDEMGQTADPGEDPRGAPDLMPLWTILDLTPGGRGTDWYPKLELCGVRRGGHRQAGSHRSMQTIQINSRQDMKLRKYVTDIILADGSWRP